MRRRGLSLCSGILGLTGTGSTRLTPDKEGTGLRQAYNTKRQADFPYLFKMPAEFDSEFIGHKGIFREK